MDRLKAIIAWIIQPDPGAWQKAIRDLVNGAFAAAVIAWGTLNLAVPGTLSEGKALAAYIAVQVGVPVAWAIVGVLRREVWPLIADRLSTFAERA